MAQTKEERFESALTKLRTTQLGKAAAELMSNVDRVWDSRARYAVYRLVGPRGTLYAGETTPAIALALELVFETFIAEAAKLELLSATRMTREAYVSAQMARGLAAYWHQLLVARELLSQRLTQEEVFILLSYSSVQSYFKVTLSLPSWANPSWVQLEHERQRPVSSVESLREVWREEQKGRMSANEKLHGDSWDREQSTAKAPTMLPAWNPFAACETEAKTAPSKRAFRLLRDLMESLVALDPGHKRLFQGKVFAPGDEKFYPRGIELAEQLFERLLTGELEWLHDRFEELERGSVPARIPIDKWRSRLPILPVEPIVRTDLDEAVLEQVSRVKSLAARWPESVRLGTSASIAEVQRARRKQRFWPKGLDAFVLACGCFSVGRTAMPRCPLVMSFAQAIGEEPEKGSLPASDERLMQHPARLQLLDVGNGDFVSFVASEDGRELWIDDCSDGPNAVRAASFLDVLRWVLDEARFASDGTWIGQWSHFFEAS